MQDITAEAEYSIHPRFILDLPPDEPTPADPRVEPSDPEVDVHGFYAQNVSIRVLKMLWAAFRWKPILQTRALSCGQRVAFVGDSNHIAIASNKGDVLCYEIPTNTYKKIYPTNQTRHFASHVHCICAQPNTVQNLGLGTASGPVVQRFVRSYKQELELDMISFGEREGAETDCLDFHPSGKQFITAGPSSAGFFVWDYSLQGRRQITTGIDRITSLSYSPCGHFIAAVSDRRWLLIYFTMDWSCVRLGTRSSNESVLSVVWSSPSPNRAVMMVAFSDSPCLDLCEVLVQRNKLLEHRLSLPSTKHHLSTTQPYFPSLVSYIQERMCRHGTFLNVKEMCWDTYGRRLAVLLDRPHPKAGHIAIFLTHLTQAPDFLSYVNAVQDLQFHWSDKSPQEALVQNVVVGCIQVCPVATSKGRRRLQRWKALRTDYLMDDVPVKPVW